MAHHVLLVLATFADKAGRARPSVSTVAAESFMAEVTADKALGRLEKTGLIAPAGSFNGTVVWQLDLSVTRGEDAAAEARARQERARAMAAERVRRHRERRRATEAGNAPAERDVTVPQGVTGATCNGPRDRDVTVSQSVGNGPGDHYVTVPRALQPQLTPAVTAIGTTTELPLELPSLSAPPRSETDGASVLTLPIPDTESSTSDSGEAFDRFWSAYPRKVAKGHARTAWAKTLKAGADPEEIIAGAGRYAAARQGQDPRYTAHPATWLGAERWTDEPPPAFASAASGWTPYRNPDDQSVYDEPLL